MNPFQDGYDAGTINDRNNPWSIFSPSWLAWQAGNEIGVGVHCAIVEAIYISEGEHA